MKDRVLRFPHEWVLVVPVADNRVRCTKCDAAHAIGSGPWPKPCTKGEMVPLSWLPKAEREEISLELFKRASIS